MALALKQTEFKQTYPVVKWAGGKRQLLAELTNNIPKNYARYFEPFVGGGALFFTLQIENAYIADTNEELINLYNVIANDVESLIANLRQHKLDKEYFLKIRLADRSPQYQNWSNVERAGRFVYLNKTCFNGLYRVNSQGQFNVPYGNYQNPCIVDEENLYECSVLLQKTTI